MAVGFPKPEARKRAKARAKREDAKRLKAFRDAVWARESARWTAPDGLAKCQRCGTWVKRATDAWVRGEVHHRIGRRQKTTRYDPRNGVLLCASLGSNDCHGRIQRKEIPCP
jgi:septal ring factor EnvC (AmiA/AmiB activator)